MGAREAGDLLQQAKRPSVADALADPCQAYVRRIRLDGALKVVEEEVTRACSTSLREDLEHFSALRARIDEPPPTDAREGPQPSRAGHERATPGSTRHDGADFWICTEAMDAVYDPAGRGCGWLDDAREAAGIQQFRATSFGSIEGGNPGWGASGARRSERVIGLHDAEVPDDWSTWAVLGSTSAGSRVWNLFEAPSSQSAHGVSMASVMVADGRKDREVDVDWHTGMARSAGVAVYDDATRDDLEGGGTSAVRGLATSDAFVSARSRYLADEPDGYAAAVFKPLCGGPSSSATEEGSDKAEEDFRCNRWGVDERKGPGRAYADQVDATFAESGLQVFFSAGNVAGNCYSEDRYSIPLGRSAFSSIAAGAVYSTPYQADFTTSPTLNADMDKLERAENLQYVSSIYGYLCGNASGPTGDGRNYPLMLGYSMMCGVATSEAKISWAVGDDTYSLVASGLDDIYYLFDGTSAAVAQLGATYVILKEWLDLEFPDLGPEDAPFYRVTFLNMGDRSGTAANSAAAEWVFYSDTGIPRHAGFGKPRLRLLDSCHFNDGALEYHAFHLHAAGDTYVAELRPANALLTTLPADLTRFRIAAWFEVNSANVEGYDDRALAMMYLQRRDALGEWETVAVTWTGDEYVPNLPSFFTLYNTNRLIRRDPHANIAVDQTWGHWSGNFPNTPQVIGGGEWRVLVLALVVPQSPQRVHLSILWETGDDASLAENRGALGWMCAVETGTL